MDYVRHGKLQGHELKKDQRKALDFTMSDRQSITSNIPPNNLFCFMTFQTYFFLSNLRLFLHCFGFNLKKKDLVEKVNIYN